MVHIGIIPDGNRRWCKKNNKEYSDLVDHWIKNMIIKYIEKYIDNTDNDYNDLIDITEISMYVSSIDNLDRDDKTYELGYDLIRRIYNIYKNSDDVFSEKIREKLNEIPKLFKLNIVGEENRLPKDIRQILNYAKSKLKGDIKINFAMAYNYKHDLINYSKNNNPYYTRDQTDIDIVMRSGGEKRISGFYPTKILYSELYFIDKFWPDISLKDICECICYFKTRNRRFGK